MQSNQFSDEYEEFCQKVDARAQELRESATQSLEVAKSALLLQKPKYAPTQNSMCSETTIENAWMKITLTPPESSELTENLHNSYTDKTLIFVATLYRQKESTSKSSQECIVLVRFKAGLHKLSASMKQNDAEKVNYIARVLHFSKSIERNVNSIEINLKSDVFICRQKQLKEAIGIFGAIGLLPKENQGHRGDTLEPQTLDANYGSMIYASNQTKMALVSTDLVESMGEAARKATLDAHRAPLFQDSHPRAVDLQSDIGANVEQTFRLISGLKVDLLATFTSGSDANNYLSDLAKHQGGIVAVAEGGYVAGRGQLKELSSRGFILKSIKEAELTSDQRRNRVWSMPYDYYSDIDEVKNPLLDHESRSLEEIQTKIVACRDSGKPVKIFLLEIYQADTMKLLRLAFLSKLSELLKKHKIALAIDEIMTGLRCGYPFLSQMCLALCHDKKSPCGRRPIKIKYMTIGKCYQIAAVLAIDVTTTEKKIHNDVRGFVTRAFDNLQLTYLMELLRVLSQHEHMEHIRNMPSSINKCFQPALLIHKGSFIRGIGAMHYTNLKFKNTGSSQDTIGSAYRLLPPLSASDADFATLQPVGIHSNVTERVSPDHDLLLREIARLWPEVSGAEAAAADPPSKRKKACGTDIGNRAGSAGCRESGLGGSFADDTMLLTSGSAGHNNTAQPAEQAASVSGIKFEKKWNFVGDKIPVFSPVQTSWSPSRGKETTFPAEAEKVSSM